jgi:hypothetical protein
MPSLGSSERTLIKTSFINGSLGAAVGGLAAGVVGAQIGVVVGLLLAVLPIAARIMSDWLARRDSLPRFVVHEIGSAAVRLATAIVLPIADVLGVASRRLQAPALLLRFAADVVRTAIRAATAALWLTVATPLGLANVAALAVIAVNLGNFEFAGPVAFLGLGMLILLLLVNENEARDAQHATSPAEEP